MANTKTKVNKAQTKSKVEVIKKALDTVEEVKSKAQTEYDDAVAALKIARH